MTRTYVILRRWPSAQVWEQVTAIVAHTPGGAVDMARDGHEEDVAEYVAVDARHWHQIHTYARRGTGG